MYKKIIVYEGSCQSTTQVDGREFLRFKLEPLLTNLRKEWKDKDCPTEIQDALFKCPSFVRSLKNTFVYKCPYDLEISYDNQKQWQINLVSPALISDHNSKNIMESGLEDNHVVQLFSGEGSRLFFADKPCEMTLEQPYFHRQDLTSLSGTFDIGRWFRPIHPAIINFGQKDFTIKRGEPLLYLRFPKDAKIEIRRTMLDADLLRLSNGTSGYKSYKHMASLKELYDYFATAVNKKRILKKLEQNRID